MVMPPETTFNNCVKFFTDKLKENPNIDVAALEPIYILPLVISDDSKYFSLDPVGARQCSVVYDSCLVKSAMFKMFPFLKGKKLEEWFVKIGDIEGKRGEEKVYPWRNEDYDFPIYAVMGPEIQIRAFANKALDAFGDLVMNISNASEEEKKNFVIEGEAEYKWPEKKAKGKQKDTGKIVELDTEKMAELERKKKELEDQIEKLAMKED